MIRGAGEDEQQIGKAVDVDKCNSGNRVLTKRHDGALSAAADRARQMQERAGRAPAGQDEPAKWRKSRLEPVDGLLESRDVIRADGGLLDPARDLVCGIRQHRAEREQVTLHWFEDRVDICAGLIRTHEPQPRIELVDVAVRADARVVLGHARPVKQRSFTVIARLCVDAHQAVADNTPVRRRKSPPLPEPHRRQWFRRRLLAWYRRHGRDLPWRQTRDPYHVLVSEMMLQQTQVDRVLPKYHEWLKRYPNFFALAAAEEREVVSTWYPLGYNIRPRRLQAIARESVERFDGTLPSDEATLRSFKGIGAYTAGAVMSFAFGKRAAILDTNVARVLFRVFVGRGDPDSHAMERHLWNVSRTVLPQRHVYDFNQALMDFGATMCSARKPLCGECPLTSQCVSFPFPIRHAR